ncbi:MAG: calcium-binding EGF-like domain-containing protein, partial [Bacteroidia bacterium]|nr:calcium-binding EGF-like domain-containing protein [Bacteroidia bacterium]
MKNSTIKFLTATILLVGIMLSQQSCNKCKDVDCKNGGICDNGKCICPEEYEGVNCEIKKHGNLTPYIGTWAGQTYYYCLMDGWPFTLTIQSNGTVTGTVYISMYVGNGMYYNCTSSLTGEAWANKPRFRFYTELQESDCTTSKMYLGGSLTNDTLAGWLSEGNPIADPPDNCFLFMLKK